LQLLEAMSPLADAVGRPPVKSAAAR
jgi:hypothetical protein